MTTPATPATSLLTLLLFPGCPHVPAARAQLRAACLAVGRAPEWNEVDVTASDVDPVYLGYGSPTILVDGVDVVAVAPVTGSACRVYPDSDVAGAPPLATVVAALRHRAAR